MLNGSKKGHLPRGTAAGTLARKKIFAGLVLEGKSYTKAAIEAGFSSKTAKTSGCHLAKDPAVRKVWADAVDRSAMTADEALFQLKLLAGSNMQDYGQVFRDGIESITREQAAAITEYTVDHTGGAGDGKRALVQRTRIKTASKLQALELVLKFHGLLKEKVEITADDDIIAALAAGRARVAKLRNGSEAS